MRSELNYRTFVVANPTAGSGEVSEEWDLIERLLKARVPEWDAAFTEGPGHATLLTREALRAGWEMIVCVGGDGTINEVVNGFYEKPDPQARFQRRDGWLEPTDTPSIEPIDEEAALGIIPVGTGSDFRRTIGLMGGLRETADHLSGRNVRPVDLGELAFIDFDGNVDTRFFLNIASAGFSGTVDEVANNMWKGLGGRSSFMLASARAFMKWQNVDLDIVIDNTIERSGEHFNFVVANGEFFGGGMWVAPGAQIDDGEFQVVEMGDLTKPEIAGLFPDIYRGRHLASPKIRRYRAEQVAARPADPTATVRIDLDGETPGLLPAHWSIHHEALNLKI